MIFIHMINNARFCGAIKRRWRKDHIVIYPVNLPKAINVTAFLGVKR